MSLFREESDWLRALSERFYSKTVSMPNGCLWFHGVRSSRRGRRANVWPALPGLLPTRTKFWMPGGAVPARRIGFCLWNKRDVRSGHRLRMTCGHSWCVRGDHMTEVRGR